MAVYKDGMWTIEYGRKLTTGSQYDIQFSDMKKEYSFGTAIFDNSQVRHRFETGVSKLVFAAQATPSTTPPFATTTVPSATTKAPAFEVVYQIFHNFMRPHQTLKGKTPSEACGIKVEGENKLCSINISFS
jgi:hypothetical protein